MNEKIQSGKEMALKNETLDRTIRTIVDKMLETRPVCEPKYRAYRKIRGVCYTNALGSMKVDLNELYPDAPEGSKAFVEFNISVLQDNEIFLNVLGECEVYYDGEHVLTIENGSADRNIGTGGGLFNIPITVKVNDDNKVRIYCTKKSDRFGCLVNLSVKRYPGMWASDYLYCARATLPVEEFAGEDGVAISELLADGKGKLSFPQETAEQGFDFMKLCSKGNTAYVYSKVKKTHQLKYSGTVSEIYVNGKAAGTDAVEISEGDELLIECEREGDKWFLELDDSYLYIPNLESQRKHGNRAVFIGPFHSKARPEISFSKIYCNEQGEKLFWRFCDNSQLRIYIDSVFFGQWFYALMVGFYGIRSSAEALGDEELSRLFDYNMQFMAEYSDYVLYDAEQNAMPTFMPRFTEANNLDNLGTMGMNFVDAYNNTHDSSMKKIIDDIYARMREVVPTNEDGTFYRIKTMWADDLYMSCPFLIRLGVLEKSDDIISYTVDQIRGFAKRLYNEEKKLFSHIYFTDKGANNVFWGRGNGWVMWTLSEVLPHIKNSDDFEFLHDLFVNLSSSLKKYHSDSGLWRQVIDSCDEGSYPETSCTAMFMLALVRGVKHGWIDNSYIEVIKKAWEGLLKYSIDSEGNVYGVCMGSGCSMEKEYYYGIPTIMNDDHGTGAVLAAASEWYELSVSIQETDKN